MFKLSEKASQDLDAALDYSIINFGAKVMAEYHNSLEKCFDILAQNPDLGTDVSYIRKDYLRFQHRSHSIFYKKTNNSIFIIRLLHKSMDAGQHFN